MAVTLTAIACSNQATSKAATTKADQLFAKWNKADSPGCGVGISRNGIVLQPLFTDAFGGNIVGVVRFSRDAHGVVTAFTVNAPGVRGLRFDRVARRA